MPQPGSVHDVPFRRNGVRLLSCCRFWHERAPGSLDSGRPAWNTSARAAALSFSRNLDSSRPGGADRLVRSGMRLRGGLGGGFDRCRSRDACDVRDVDGPLPRGRSRSAPLYALLLRSRAAGSGGRGDFPHSGRSGAPGARGRSVRHADRHFRCSPRRAPLSRAVDRSGAASRLRKPTAHLISPRVAL